MKALLDKAKDAAKKADDLAKQGVAEAKDKGEELVARRQLDALARELGYISHRIHRGEESLEPERERLLLAMDGAHAAMGEMPDDYVETVGLDA